MSLTKLYPTDGVEFTVSYEKDGKQMTWNGTGQMQIERDADYGEIEFGYNIARPYLRSEQTTITLNNVQNLKGTLKTLRNDMEQVTTTRKIVVPDFTFDSISKARKRAGAPKESTFKTMDDYSEKSVTFTWQETL